MTLSITDRVLPEARSLLFESNSYIATKALKFTAGRLTETVRIFASLVEQVALRALYYTSFPTKWVTPSIHNRLSSQLTASNQSLKNGIRNFVTVKKPAVEKKLLSKPVAFLERLKGHLPKISTRTVLIGVAIGVIGISLVYFGPDLFSKPKPPPVKPFDGALTLYNPLTFEGPAGAGKELPPIKILMTGNIYKKLIHTVSQIPPDQPFPFEVQDGEITCGGIMQNFQSQGIIQSDCWERLTKYTLLAQKQTIIADTNSGMIFEADLIRKFQPAKLNKCLSDTCSSLANKCFNNAKNRLEQLFCTSSDFKAMCSLKNIDQCAKKVGKVVEEYRPFKCLIAKDGSNTCTFLDV